MAGLSVMIIPAPTTAALINAYFVLVSLVGLLGWDVVWFVTIQIVQQLVQAVLLKALQVANGTWVVGWPAPMVATSTVAVILAAHYSYTAMPAVTAALEHS